MFEGYGFLLTKAGGSSGSCSNGHHASIGAGSGSAGAVSLGGPSAAGPTCISSSSAAPAVGTMRGRLFGDATGSGSAAGNGTSADAGSAGLNSAAGTGAAWLGAAAAPWGAWGASPGCHDTRVRCSRMRPEGTILPLARVTSDRPSMEYR